METEPEDSNKVPVAKLRVMGDIEVMGSGEAQKYEKALVITFESNDDIRAAIRKGRCELKFL
jgi:hypothetical protein